MYEIKHGKRYGFENDSQASLTCFLNPAIRTIGRRCRMGMIILPGGAYSSIDEREADPVAARYMGYGLQCFVLRYSTDGPDCYVNALRQLGESVALLRENSDQWDIDPERIILCEFSAGGHLAASLGCYSRRLSDWIGADVRPNALLLGYPVDTAGNFMHKESIDNCLRSNAYGAEDLSLENHMGVNMPPAFLWACADDKDVPVQNSLLLSTALAEKKVPFELHIFCEGGHGGSLGDECTARIEGQINDRYAEWFHTSLKWLREVL